MKGARGERLVFRGKKFHTEASPKEKDGEGEITKAGLATQNIG